MSKLRELTRTWSRWVAEMEDKHGQPVAAGLAADMGLVEQERAMMNVQQKTKWLIEWETLDDPPLFANWMIEKAEALEARLSKMEEALADFDIQGAKSWAHATAEQWNHSDAETRQIMHGGMKVAEKLLAILPGLEEALAGEGDV